MAQFDVCRARNGTLVIDCQSDLLRSLPTRFVVPLRAKDESVTRRLNPVFLVDGKQLTMVTQLAGSIDARAVTQVVTSLAEHDLEIKSALDMLISGF